MTLEEMYNQYEEKMHLKRLFGHKPVVMQELKKAYHIGAKENGIVWHKITDWKDQEQFPDNICEEYLVYINLKYLEIKQYAVCCLDITEGCRQFYLDDGDDDIDPEDVIAWCEIPQFKE